MCVCVFAKYLVLHFRMCVCVLVKCVVLSPLCVFPCVCTSVMCCNGVVASGMQTARIRHGDKGSLCRRMSNALTDESETPLSPSPLSLFPLWLLLLIFTLSLSSPSSFIPHLIQSLPLAPISISLRPSVPFSHHPSFCLPLVIPLLLFLAVRCSFALHFSLSLYFLSHFTHLLSLSVSILFHTSLSKFKCALLI